MVYRSSQVQIKEAAGVEKNLSVLQNWESFGKSEKPKKRLDWQTG